jgi:hypothetical protein
MPMTAAPDLPATPRAFRTLRLTDRWTPMKPHHLQQLFFWHSARFKINPSGRRSGKTEIVKRKAALKLLQKNKQGNPGTYFLAAPSKDQARRIFWRDMQALIPSWWIAYKNETRMEIRTHWGAYLQVFGFDNPKVIEGAPWDWGAIDEIADCPPQCFALNVRPAMSTLGREGGCDLIGVPDEVGRNQAEYEQLWAAGLGWDPDPGRSIDPEICSFHWRSADILDPKEIAAVRQTMDELAFEQEYGGRFMTSGGKATPKFDTSLHVDAEYCTYERLLPLDWSLDFGVDPAASLLGQSYRRHVWIMDELILNDSSTDVAADAMVERASLRGYSLRHVRVFGDAAGNSRHSNVGTTDYEILEKKLRHLNVEWLQLTAAPAIKDSLNAVRTALCSADNVIHLHIHPRCKTLINDLKTAPWPSDLRQFHALAALRYYLYRLYGADAAPYATGSLNLSTLRAAT